MSSTPSAATRHPYRWVVLVLAWAAFTMTAVDRATWGPASLAVSEHLGVALAGLGVFATGYYVGYVISNAAGGVLTDWLGPRLVIGCSLFLAGVFMVLFGETDSVALGIAFQAGIGIFAGCDYSAGVKIVSQWFPSTDRGFAMGFFLTATSLGTVIANAIVPSLIAASGWSASYHVFGVASMGVAVICGLLLRPAPDGTRREPRQAPDLRPLARNRDLWLLGLAGFGGMWGTAGFITWANALMVKGGGVSPVQAGVVVTIFAIAGLVAKPLIGIASDLFGARRKVPAALVFGAFVITLLVFGTRESLAGFLWVAPFLGVAAYMYSPLLVALVPGLAGVRLAGSAAGATNAFWQVASTIVPTVVGAVFAGTGSFLAAFAVLAAGPLVGMVLVLLIDETSTREPKIAESAGEKERAIR